MILKANSEDPDKTARVHILTWAVDVRVRLKTRFRIVRPP